jgi:hypothetical protein
MDRILSRGIRVAFGAAVLATTGFGVRSAIAEPGAVREAARVCPPDTYTCICDGVVTCRRIGCPLCP